MINCECMSFQALKIVKRGLDLYGSYSKWEQNSGGPVMATEEVRGYVKMYLESIGIDHEIKVKYIAIQNKKQNT